MVFPPPLTRLDVDVNIDDQRCLVDMYVVVDDDVNVDVDDQMMVDHVCRCPMSDDR